MIGIVYHCYLVNDWEEVVTKQFNRLVNSGLYAKADEIHVTCIFLTEENKQRLSELLQNYTKCQIKFVTENHYEYEGINTVHELAKKYDDMKILYFHSKGVSNKYKRSDRPEEISELKVSGVAAWKEVLEHFLIDNWKMCIEKLDSFDNVGVTCDNGWFWGNFWWSQSKHIKKCPTPLCHVGRWYYEAWLNEGIHSSNYEFYKFNFNPYRCILPKKFYDGTYVGKMKDLNIISAAYETYDMQVDEGRPVNEEIKSADVTALVQNYYNLHGNINDIPVNNDWMGGDPLWGVQKQLSITFTVKGFDEINTIVYDEYRATYLNFV